MTTLTFVPPSATAHGRRLSTRHLMLLAFWPGVLFLAAGVGLLNPREGLRIWNEARVLLS
jgi:hypothetical protein